MTAPFTEELRGRIAAVVGRYPEKSAALLPVLHLVQKERGFIGPDDERAVAAILGLRPVSVREVLTFYTMFRRAPSGRRLLQVCTNLACTIRGGERILDFLRKILEIEPGQTTPDGQFTLIEVECLGACDKGPCLMIGDDLHESLTPEKVEALLREAGRP
jgi:NADH-quinone oxidoreductase E subunit